jgi:hypothetical protein
MKKLHVSLSEATAARCPKCKAGDCYGHVAEYLDSNGHVSKCKCPDLDRQHGKLRIVRSKS